MELFNRVEEHYERNLPFVVYRKPGDTTCRALLQKDGILERVNDFRETGFVMAPFTEGLPVIRIRPDEYLEESVELPENKMPFASLSDDADQEGKAAYIHKVDEALDAIYKREFQKVVLSRKITHEQQPNPFATFSFLLSQFPEAFCYMLYHPEIGMWMGASPETLLQYRESEIRTVSLAGTQKWSGQKEPQWQEKELREQDYVTRYIVNALEPLADPPKVSGPDTVRAGNLLHLKSEIIVSNPRTGIGTFIQALHPTPAVCGIPMEKARKYLLNHEGYPREYYTGYLGELNWGETKASHLFVNLRCMKFQEGKVHIYVGGGLVEGSVPELEWQETVFKSESMQHLLRNSYKGLG